eukprot:1918359-Amphidinium_carterae.1
MPSATCTWSCHQRMSSKQPTQSQCAVCYLGACTALRMPRRFGKKTTPNCLEGSTGSRETATVPSSTTPAHRQVTGTSCGAW